VTAWGRAALLGALVPVVACTVDTELGVAASIDGASIDVSASPDGDVVGIELDMEFRVGEHAMGAREFVVPRADVVVDDRPVAQINLNRPAGFDGMLAPGESETVRIDGTTAPGAFPAARAALCEGSPTAEVLVRWEDRTEMVFDMTHARTDAISCD